MEKTLSTTSVLIAAQDAKAPAQSTLRAYLAMLMQVSRWHLIGVIIVTVLSSLSEGIGLALLLPTLQVAGLNLAGQGEAGRYAAIVRAPSLRRVCVRR